MRQYRLPVLTLGFVLAAAAPSYADDAADARALVDKAIKAHGGAEALAKYKAAVMAFKGTYHGMGMELPMAGTISALGADRLKVEVEVDAVNEPLPVSGDPDLLRSAVENVVRNAVRYTDARRGVAIHCGSGGGRARVVVRDYGPGVPESELERIFEPFHRVADDRTRASGGNGIGLAITARVLRSHDGSVRARNAVGGGLEVVLELPLGGRDTT